jgi:hypothetical protein
MANTRSLMELVRGIAMLRGWTYRPGRGSARSERLEIPEKAEAPAGNSLANGTEKMKRMTDR